MNHSDFYRLMRTTVNLGNNSLSVLREDDKDDPEILGVRLVQFALKAKSIGEVISYFEKVSLISDDLADFLLHLQVFLKGTELLHMRLLTLAQFRPTLFSKEERIETAFQEADREVRLKKLDIWIDQKIAELRQGTTQTEFLLKWTGPASKFVELLITLDERKWIDLKAMSNPQLAKTITKLVRFNQPPKENSILDNLKADDYKALRLEDRYQNLFHRYRGPHFSGVLENPGLKEAKPKPNAGRRKPSNV